MDGRGSKMNLANVNYFEKVEAPKHREFINMQNNCVLCCTVLELRHVSDKETNTVKEEAFCPECDLRVRAKNYSLN